MERKWPFWEAPSPLVKVTAVTAPFCSHVALRRSSVGFFPEGLAQGYPSANGRLKGWHSGSQGWDLSPNLKTFPESRAFPTWNVWVQPLIPDYSDQHQPQASALACLGFAATVTDCRAALQTGSG